MAFVTTYSRFRSPVGAWLARERRRVADRACSPSRTARCPTTDGWRQDDAFFAGVRDQLAAYFAGRLVNFTVPLAPGAPISSAGCGTRCV